MGALPGRARGQCNGKLTRVLDHQLRVGSEKVSETVSNAYKARGLQPPGHIDDPPAVLPQYLAYWEAYRDLISERRAPRGPIPALSIIQYANAYQLDCEALKRIVWAVDAVLLAHWNALDDAADVKRKAEANKPATLGGNR